MSLNLDARKQEREEERASRLAPGNAFLISKGLEPVQTIVELRDAIREYREANENMPDAIVEETGYILGDYMSLRSGISMATQPAPSNFVVEEVE